MNDNISEQKGAIHAAQLLALCRQTKATASAPDVFQWRSTRLFGAALLRQRLRVGCQSVCWLCVVFLLRFRLSFPFSLILLSLFTSFHSLLMCFFFFFIFSPHASVLLSISHLPPPPFFSSLLFSPFYPVHSIEFGVR